MFPLMGLSEGSSEFLAGVTAGRPVVMVHWILTTEVKGVSARRHNPPWLKTIEERFWHKVSKGNWKKHLRNTM